MIQLHRRVIRDRMGSKLVLVVLQVYLGQMKLQILDRKSLTLVQVLHQPKRGELGSTGPELTTFDPRFAVSSDPNRLATPPKLACFPCGLELPGGAAVSS